MTNKGKVLAAVVAVVVVLAGGVGLYLKGGDLMGRMGFSVVPKCEVSFGNFDPNSGTIAKYGDDVDFKWNGPGCSRYELSQYLLCFENVANSQEFACIGVKDNHKTLSVEDWEWINGNMKTLKSKNRVETYWYVQSRFGNALKGETKTTEPWKFSYSTYGVK